jgi:hypothetical protein
VKDEEVQNIVKITRSGEAPFTIIALCLPFVADDCTRLCAGMAGPAWSTPKPRALRYGRLMIMTDRNHDGQPHQGPARQAAPPLLRLKGCLQVRIAWAVGLRKSGAANDAALPCPSP